MSALYIVDAVNILFRSYYAIGRMSSPDGKPTGALYGFIRSLYKIIHDFSPDRFVAVFDGEDNKKSRSALYSGYKSHRTRMPEDLVSQLEDALYFCQIAGIPHLSIAGVEADDTIGSIARWAEKKGDKVVIYSSDKDLCQLISPQIQILSPHKEGQIMDRTQVKETFGVYPEQIPDWIALMGDSSDNIPGVEGIGEKTASDLLEKFETLENIYHNLHSLPEKRKNLLSAGKEMAFLSQKLAHLDLTVEIPKDPLFFHLKQPNLEDVSAFFHKMHFLSLLKELSCPAQPGSPGVVIETLEDLKALVHRLKNEQELCIDTETTAIDPLRAELVGIGLGTLSGEAWYIPMHGKLQKHDVIGVLKSLFQLSDIGWIGHNIKYDLHILEQENLKPQRIVFDTILASYLLSPHIQKHNLDELALSHLHKTKIPIDSLLGKGKTAITMADVPIAKVADYCCEDVICTTELKAFFEPKLKNSSLQKVFQEIEIPLISVLERMEERGIYVDLKELSALLETFTKEIETIEKKIHAISQQHINLNSPKQLGVLLFETLGIKSPKKTKTGYSTAADVLDSLKAEHPIIPLILSYRLLDKLRSTYTTALIESVHPRTQRIHCTFNQSVTATGRLSCQNPNLQNIPVRSKEGKLIRSAFKPQTDDVCFVSFDYSQIELRLLAHFSSDPALLKAFAAGEDIHARTASLVFDTPLESVTSEMRSLAKAVNFGILYGQQAFGLSQQVGIPFEEAKLFIKTYFERYPHVKAYLQTSIDSAREKGYAETPTGRKRPIPDLSSPNPMLRSQAERFAINTPLQGTNADIIKMAMIQVDTYLQTHPGFGHMILQIHDELLLEVPKRHIPEVSKHVRQIMENILPLQVPLIVDISIGKNWGEC